MITPADHKLLRRAIGIAAHAVTLGDAPYGSLLADPDGAILAEAHNTVWRGNDVTACPELKLAWWVAGELAPERAVCVTLCTSCEPCGMCAGGIVRSGLGRVVYALSAEQLVELNPASGQWPTVAQDGPALFDEARAPIDAYYRPH
ncbi:nucleoside deaminase [Streptomyces abikoensis]|uniref:nucleoside deaminase n=1 Tax=Streptomyces abikoensis TaxID=97398 RepID=UPI003673D0B3